MSDTAKSSNSMPSTCNNNNKNSNNATINANTNNNHQTNTEQPKIKRQKIEKLKSNAKTNTTTTTTTATTTPVTKRTSHPPDLIETGVTNAENSGKRNSENNNKQLCSSLSSSAHSISSAPSSLNNSPTSTPSSSRATSLTQLLNVQSSLANNLPPTTNSTASISSNSISNSDNNDESSKQHSTDEVDRIGVLPDLLPPKTADTKVAKPMPMPMMMTMTMTTGKQQQATCSSNVVDAAAAVQDMRQFELSLTRQCLCGVSEDALQKPFQSHYSLNANGQKRIANLNEWPTSKLLQFLSNLQLLFDIYLKQNSKGFICARIMDVCDALIRNDRNLIDEIIVLASYSNSYVRFLAGRVLASFLVIAKQELDDNWLKKLVDNLFFLENLERLDCNAVQNIHFSLEIIKRIVDWKDIDLHPLEDEIVDTRNHANIVHVPVTTNLIESHQHAYMHLQARQPQLESNYFAVHFQGLDSGPPSEISTISNERPSNGHEHQVLENERTPSHHSSIIAMQEQINHFGNMLHMPGGSNSSSSGSIEHGSVPTNFTISNSDIGGSHFSTAYISPVQSSSIPATYGNSTNHNTSAAYNDNISSAHFQLNSTTLHHSSPMRQPLGSPGDCNIVTLTDSESFDTTNLKCITIKILENKWPALVGNMSKIIANHLCIDNAENCVLNFLQLWENIISVKANLSIVETTPFYAQLDEFELLLLNRDLPCIVYKQMLCLFNEALCYGSTLALQDIVPDETRKLAQQIVKLVKDYRILESLPRRQPENCVGLIGFKHVPIVYEQSVLQATAASNNGTNVSFGTGGITNNDENNDTFIEMDKTILQKMVLLVLKSIAVTVKEIRSDSSDSSIDSTDYDAFQDMVVIERSIRTVLRKLEAFIKGTLDFHPECHFSKILIHLFDDQDDHLIEAMVCTLDVTSGISFRNNAFPELVAMLNPVYTFLEFLKMVSNSSDLLLDLLVSNETCFLLYLLRFLKYIRLNWTMFVQSCHDFGMGTNALDEAMSVLIRLRLQISRLVSRQLYPYDISPVLRLLESCESLYEGNELA